NVIIGIIACKEVPVCIKTQAFHWAECHSQSSCSLSRTAHLYIIHFNGILVLIYITHIYHHFTTAIRHNLAFSIHHEAFRCPIPAPVSPREHTVNFHPAERLGNKVKLYTHVVSLRTGHVHCPTLGSPVYVFIGSGII